MGVHEQVRTREAPTPTNISTKLEPVKAKEGDLRLARHGACHEGLPATGRPDHQKTAGPIAPARA